MAEDTREQVTGEVIDDSAGDGEFGMSGGAIEAMTRGEIDIQIKTAKAYPRSIAVFKKTAMELATLTPQVAESCIYALRRKDSNGREVFINGPSVRLAEIVASCWGHMRVDARIIDDTGDFVTARGMAWDLQNNVAVAMETRRRIVGKGGRRYGPDMIGVTGNAAASIAFRNAVFKVVPKPLVDELYEGARKVVVGDATTINQRRQEMIAYFGKMNVSPEKIFAILPDVKGEADINLDHLATLKALAQQIKKGEISVDEVFNPKTEAAGDNSPKGASALADKLRQKDAEQGGAPKTTTVAPTPTQPKAETAKPTPETPKAETAPQVKQEAPKPDPEPEQEERAPETAQTPQDEDREPQNGWDALVMAIQSKEPERPWEACESASLAFFEARGFKKDEMTALPIDSERVAEAIDMLNKQKSIKVHFLNWERKNPGKK